MFYSFDFKKEEKKPKEEEKETVEEVKEPGVKLIKPLSYKAAMDELLQRKDELLSNGNFYF